MGREERRMTRLIDADKALWFVPMNKRIEYAKWIDAQPTIEAIPVDWIYSEAEKCSESAPLTAYAIMEILRIWEEHQ